MMATKSPGVLAWSSPEPGVYKRALGSLELLYAHQVKAGLDSGQDSWTINSVARLSFPDNVADPIPYLQRAWTILRTLHPIIGATLDTPDGGEWTMTIKSTDDEAWIEESFHIEEDAPNATEFLHRNGHTRYGMHWNKNSSEVSVHYPHWRADGMGIIRLWGVFFDLLAKIIQDGPDGSSAVEDGLLARAVEDLMDVSTDDMDTPAYIIKERDLIVKGIMESVPSIGLPIKAGTDPQHQKPGASKRRSSTLDEHTTKAVAAAAKEKGAHIVALINTAMLRALVSYPQHPQAKNNFSLVPVDLRKYIPSAYESIFGPYAFTHVLTVANVAGKSFDELLNEVNAVFRKNFARMTTDGNGNSVSIAKTTPALARTVDTMLKASVPVGTPPNTVPNCSSLGIIENHVKHEYNCGSEKMIVVENVLLGGRVCGADLWCHITTWRNRLTIPAVFNEAYHDPSSVEDFLERTMGELLKVIEIET